MLLGMTEPQFGGTEGVPPPNYQAPPPSYPMPPQYPGPGGYVDPPSAPFGRHPVTGEPLSDKSKVVAGLLQLLGLFGLVGIGRIYSATPASVSPSSLSASSPAGSVRSSGGASWTAS